MKRDRIIQDGISPRTRSFGRFSQKALSVAAIAVAAAILTTVPMRAQTSTTKDVMKFKLHYAQGVLEGIATENFDLIETNALKLKNLTQQVDWQIRDTPEYQRYSADFRQRAESLVKAAKAKNVDAATVAYFEMTVSCTTCHKYLKGGRGVSLPLKEHDPNLGMLRAQFHVPNQEEK